MFLSMTYTCPLFICKLCNNSMLTLEVSYVGVSESFETSSIDCQPMAVREWVRSAWEQGTSPLSVLSGIAV
jgi:hypothetical protein